MKFSWFMWDALCDLVPFAQFQKVEKHPRRSVTVNNVAGLPWVFFTFSKVCKLYHIAQNVSYESRGFYALSHTNSKSNQTRPNSIFNPSRRYPGRTEKIILNFYFHTFLWCLKKFYDGVKGHWRRSCVFIVNFKHVWHLFVVFLLLTLNK